MNDTKPEDQQKLKERYEAYQQAKEQEKKIKEALVKVLEPAAYERLANVRLANPELYSKAVQALLQLYQRAGRKITEKELVILLSSATAKREGSIQIKRK